MRRDLTPNIYRVPLSRCVFVDFVLVFSVKLDGILISFKIKSILE
jgi:hypothetical protein